MTLPVYEFVGGPLDGDRVVLEHGDQYRVPLQPILGYAKDWERVDPLTFVRPREATYTLRLMPSGERCLVWDGEA